MSKLYPELAEKFGKDSPNGKLLSCTVCHPMKDNQKKKLRNNYGVAFGEGLEKKNEKDEKKLEEAFTKAAKGKSATKDKTFGDLIKDLELPGTDEPANKED
ncbi:MAG: hypothetical protein R3C19_20535 [Planctomycetaceae bacterium]